MSELINFILNHEESFKSKNRLISLYSDFSALKSSNPDGYRANVSAWTSALTNAARAGLLPGSSRLCVRVDSTLSSELEVRNVGRPVALDAVLEDAIASKTMMTLQDYMQATTSILEKRWINFHIPSAWQVAQWGLRQVGIGGSKLSQQDIVIFANLEYASKTILAKVASLQSSTTSLIYSLETFSHDFASIFSIDRPLTTTDLDIILTYLTRDKHVASMHTSTETGSVTIKFSPSVSKAIPQPITPHDETIANLRTLSLRLDNQIAKLNDSIAALEVTAREAVASSNKSRALQALRARKMATATLDKREASLEQVSSVLLSIDDAATQVEMVRAMEASTGVLRYLNKQVGGVDRVDTVMDELREQMADAEDVSKVLGEVGAEGASAVNEDELDDELEAMLNETKSKAESTKQQQQPAAQDTAQQAQAELLKGAPTVPSGLPETLQRHEGLAGAEKVVSTQDGDDLEKRLKMMSLSSAWSQRASSVERNEKQSLEDAS